MWECVGPIKITQLILYDYKYDIFPLDFKTYYKAGVN